MIAFSITSPAAVDTPADTASQSAKTGSSDTTRVSGRQETEPGHGSSLSLTVTGASDYRFRGVSLSDRRPVAQGSLDFQTALIGGVTGNIGLWYSTVRIDANDLVTPTGGQSVPQSKREQGVYYGLSGPLAGGFHWAAQIENYVYPGFHELNHDEYRLALSRGFNGLPLLHAVEVAQTRFKTANPGGGGHYLEVNLHLKPAAKWDLIGHVGQSQFDNHVLGGQDYVDRSLTLSREFDAYKVEMVAVATNTRQFGRLGDSGLLVRISRSF